MIASPHTYKRVVDANEAVADVAYRLSEIVSIFPITPSSPMAEQCDEWSASGRVNLWHQVPEVVQMQSEAGVAGTYHGTLSAGSLSTTFTASQGLLLMIPNMYKIAGELLPTVMHVSARALATNALSIFGDHSDVMACRQTGWAMLASNNVQEAHDMAAIAHAATLLTRLPFLHFFDGFRTSHEVNVLQPVADEVLHQLIDPSALAGFYARGLTPDKPSIRGSAHNPDTYFQSREAVNPFYRDAAATVQGVMDHFARLTGRSYRNFEYRGAEDAETVLIMMGSGADTAMETTAWLNRNEGAKTGVLSVRLYRPWNTKDLLAALPSTVRRLVVLDRTKEPGSVGEPLYLDVALSLRKAGVCVPEKAGLATADLCGGRYGIGSKEFTPAMVRSVLDAAATNELKDHFTVGIRDDVTYRSIQFNAAFNIESASTRRAVFWGLGSDGTVGANKNTIKIIGEYTDFYTQAYFVYDSKKSGGLTTSHLRFGPDPIRAPYLIEQAQFVACHQFQFMGRMPVLDMAAQGGTFLLNSPYAADQVLRRLPADVVATMRAKELKVYVIDADGLARNLGLGNRINVIMQTCFFALTDLLPIEQAQDAIKDAIAKTYGKKGGTIVALNNSAVDAALAHLAPVDLAVEIDQTGAEMPVQVLQAPLPDFVQRVTAQLLAGRGDLLPVSAFPADGNWPTATSRYEKRRIASTLPIWNADTCTQCNKCSLFCPHAAIRPKFYDEAAIDGAPSGFRSAAYKAPGAKGKRFTIQVYPEDCTGCNACVEICPATGADGLKALVMQPVDQVLAIEQENLCFFQQLPQPEVNPAAASVRNLSFCKPLFEFSGACSGCTQTPYVRMLTQLFGDRLMLANATGCSSIYGGNLPTTPYCQDDEGRGPAWANSLFEDNAEFGLGLHLSGNYRRNTALAAVQRLFEQGLISMSEQMFATRAASPTELANRRSDIAKLLVEIAGQESPEATTLRQHADYLVAKTTWIVGGDGWAYDIGFGGLDHVLAGGHDVNVLVLDTEVYSNTGGQASKSTPIGAMAKFAAAGKARPKKELAQIAMTYGNIYVAQIALGANEQQALDVLREAESFPGPSLVIAYGPCAAHGIDLAIGPARQKAAVESGYWPLYRFDPRNAEKNLPTFRLESFKPTLPVAEFMRKENRFRALSVGQPERALQFEQLAQEWVDARWAKLEQLAALSAGGEDDDEGWG